MRNNIKFFQSGVANEIVKGGDNNRPVFSQLHFDNKFTNVTNLASQSEDELLLNNSDLLEARSDEDDLDLLEEKDIDETLLDYNSDNDQVNVGNFYLTSCYLI